MIKENMNKLFAALLLIEFIPFFVIPINTESVPPLPSVGFRQSDSWEPNGPYVDRAIFEVLTGPDVQVASLIAGDIDYIADVVESSYFEELAANPNIELIQTERLGFGFMAINCQRYPYSIPALRRAIAFAMDKHKIATTMWEEQGYALDNPIPPSCGVWHNSQITPDFRDPNVMAARAELASAGFIDLDGDGFVEAPNGESFTFRPMVAIEAPHWERALNTSIPYWEQAGIRAIPRVMAFGSMLDIVYTVPRNYDAACYSFGISPNPLVLQNFISSEIANPEGNFLNWGNDTFDLWVDIMMTANDPSLVLESAYRSQQVFVENAPMIVMYSNLETYAHRTDKFEGWIEIPGWGLGASNCWNPVKVRLQEGQPERDPNCGVGGTLRTTISSAMDSQNPLTSTSVYGKFPLAQVYSKLTGLNDGNHQPTKRNGGLAYDWRVEPHPNGSKYTFTLYNNATWHDLGGSSGGFVTAYDVEFSYNYIREHRIPTYSRRIPYLNSCQAIDDTHVEIITNGESIWAFDFIRDWVILPEHIWEGVISPVTFLNPRPIGCGPFRWYHRREGEYVELHYWENYHKGIVGCFRGPDDWCCPTPIYMVIAVLVVVGTLVLSYVYLSIGRRNARETEHQLAAMERWSRESVATMRDVYCINCGTSASEGDRFCAECGQRIKE